MGSPTEPAPLVVAVTHELEPDDAVLTGLAGGGVRVLRWSAVRTVSGGASELREAWRRLAPADWVAFTSRRAVEEVFRAGLQIPAGVRVAAVGARVVGALEAAGTPVDLVGEGGGDALGRALAKQVAEGTRVLFPAAAGASPALEEALSRTGVEVERVTVYRTERVVVDTAACAADLAAGVDAVTFLSPSAVESLIATLDPAGLGPALRRVMAVCIGPTTAAAALGAGFRRVHTATRPEKAAVAEAVLELGPVAAAAQRRPIVTRSE